MAKQPAKKKVANSEQMFEVEITRNGVFTTGRKELPVGSVIDVNSKRLNALANKCRIIEAVEDDEEPQGSNDPKKPPKPSN